MNKSHQSNILWQKPSCVATIRKLGFGLMAALFVTLCCMHPAKTHAQYFSVIEQGLTTHAYYFPTSVANWVDKSNRYTIAVVSYELSQRIRLIEHHYFFTHNMFYTGNVTGIQEIDIPEGMYIEDIETIGGYAIFCGRTMTTNPSIGIIGYLNIDDFIFTSPASVTVNWRFVDSTTNVKELVVQEVLGQYHVVALGEKLIDNYITYFAVENTDLFSPLSQFDVAKLSDNSTIRETAYEIKMTNEYFVLIGTESQDKALYFRRCSRSIGLTDTEFDNIYYLPAPPQEALSKTHSTPTYGNVLAISYLSGLSGSTPFSIKIRTLDVGKLLFYNSQEIRIDDKAEPSDIVYLTNANRLVLLQDLYFPFGSSAMESLFIDIVPSTVTYVTPVYYYSGCLFYKVDNIDYKGSTYIALGDRDRYMIKDDMSPWPGSDASCPTKDNIKVSIISELSIFSRSVPLVHSPISTDIKTDLNIVVSYPPNPLCTSD